MASRTKAGPARYGRTPGAAVSSASSPSSRHRANESAERASSSDHVQHEPSCDHHPDRGRDPRSAGTHRFTIRVASQPAASARRPGSGTAPAARGGAQRARERAQQDRHEDGCPAARAAAQTAPANIHAAKSGPVKSGVVKPGAKKAKAAKSETGKHEVTKSPKATKPTRSTAAAGNVASCQRSSSIPTSVGRGGTSTAVVKSAAAAKTQANKKGVGANGTSRLRKPGGAAKMLTKDELADLMTTVDGYSSDQMSSANPPETEERPADRGDNLSDPKRKQHGYRAQPAVRRNGNGKAVHDGEDVDSDDGVKAETSWRQGDNDSGELGLGGISQEDRSTRSNRSRLPQPAAVDINSLVDQIKMGETSSKLPAVRTNRHDTSDLDVNDENMRDLMDLSSGFDADAKNRKTSLRKPGPSTAPKPKLEDGDLEKLLNRMDFDINYGGSGDQRTGEVADKSDCVNTWRTGDGDDEKMNKLRIKARAKNVPSQAPKWAIDDLITNRKPRDKERDPTRNSVSSRRQGTFDVGTEADRDREASPAAHETTAGEFKPKMEGSNGEDFYNFSNFIADSLSSLPRRQEANVGANHKVHLVESAQSPLKKHGTRSKAGASETLLTPTRAANSGTSPSRKSRVASGERDTPTGASPKTRESQPPAVRHHPSPAGANFLDDIIRPKRASSTAASASRHRKSRSPADPDNAVKRSTRSTETRSRPTSESLHSICPSQGATSSDQNTRHSQVNVRATRPRDSSPTLVRTVSPSESRSTSPAKSRSASPTKPCSASSTKSRSASPIKSRSASPIKSRSASPIKSRSASPIKSRSASPIKSRSSSPGKSFNSPKQSYIDSTQKPWPRISPPSWRQRRSRTPSPDKEIIHDRYNDAVRSGFLDTASGRQQRGDSSDRRTQRVAGITRPHAPSPVESRHKSARTASQHEARQPPDAVDRKPKRKSLSLAGMSNPERDDEGERLRNLIASTEAMEKDLLTLS